MSGSNPVSRPGWARWLVASLAGGAVSMALGFLLYRVLLGSFVDTQLNPAILRPDGVEIVPAIVVGQIAFGALAATCLVWLDARSTAQGLVLGAVLGVLGGLWFDLTFYGSWNVFTLVFTALDAVLLAVRGAVAGAVIAWILVRGRPLAALS